MLRIDVPENFAHDPYGYAARTHAREIVRAAGEFAKAVYTYSCLSLREFEGARIRVAKINGCLICQQFRSARDVPALAAASGARPANLVSDNGPEPDEEFYAQIMNWRSSTIYSERERLTIEFAELFALEPKELALNEEFWLRLKARFNDGEIVDLAHSVGDWLALGRVTHVLGFDSICGPSEAFAD